MKKKLKINLHNKNMGMKS